MENTHYIDCVFCFEQIITNSIINDKSILIHCMQCHKHEWHRKCIKRYINSGDKRKKKKCPLCRGKLSKVEVEEFEDFFDYVENSLNNNLVST
jgi:hypothetical protein